MVALGTDFPVEGINPLATFYAAVVRKDAKGYPSGGFQPENALTREEALNGMTLWAAVSNFEEEQKGTIEVGKVADFVVLDRDLLVVSDEEILQTKVMQTWIGGEMLYQNRE
jgi:predicted amidohydrolase YtcJ